MSEFSWIDKYLKPIATSPAARGLSDDVASLDPSKAGRPIIVTMDTMIEGVHFLPSDPVETLGKKLVRVNVSDILCKGAEPRQALLSLAIPASFSEAQFEAFCSGIAEDLAAWNIDLIGGDFVSTPGPFTLTIALTGECVGPEPVSRSGADGKGVVFVTGHIGVGVLGLHDAKTGRGGPAVDHYRVPNVPGLPLAGLVAEFADASIDLSDGLLADAGHVSRESKVGIEIDLGKVPWPRSVEHLDDMLRLAAGGDDYQTLLVVSQSRADAFLAAAEISHVPVTRIGRTSLDWAGVRLVHLDRPVSLPKNTGFNHRKA